MFPVGVIAVPWGTTAVDVPVVLVLDCSPVVEVVGDVAAVVDVLADGAPPADATAADDAVLVVVVGAVVVAATGLGAGVEVLATIEALGVYGPEIGNADPSVRPS